MEDHGAGRELLEEACLHYGVRPGTEDYDPAYGDSAERRQRAARILRLHPEVARESLHAAVVCGDRAEVERILSQRPGAASEKGGPQGWEPLLYLCFARLPTAAAGENALAIARALLDHGADPNVYFTDGENHFTPLTGAMGEGERPPSAQPPHPQAAALARLLRERGADPHDLQGFYNTALWRDDPRWLELLGAEGMTPATLDSLLGHAVERNHLVRARWLLEHGAGANAVDGYRQQKLLELALLNGLSDMAALLVRFGAEAVAIEEHDAFRAACLRLDRAAARALLERRPEALHAPGPMTAAAEHDLVEVAALLLDLGMSPDVRDPEGGPGPLHSAAGSDSARVAALLLEHGAAIDSRDPVHDATPLGWAVYMERPRTIELLSAVSRDVFSLAAAGKVERLRQLLAAEPELARVARGDVTPLFCLPLDPDRALATAQVLLAHGADPGPRNRAGLTAADRARSLGLDAVADRLAGSVP
jgi:ankyrin repeat protein